MAGGDDNGLMVGEGQQHIGIEAGCGAQVVVIGSVVGHRLYDGHIMYGV